MFTYLLMGTFSYMDNVQHNLSWDSIFATSDCLFVGSIITLEPLDQFAQILIWGTQQTHGNLRLIFLR